MKQNPIFSVIIPHKNTPDLLQRCLNSIPRSSDVQIIVVDDNSGESAVDFDHFPGLNDPFVEVILTKEGKGAGYARNIGLTKAKGKWLLFADADDFFVKNAFDILFAYANASEEIIFFKPTSIYSDTGEPAERANSKILFIDNFLSNKKYSEDFLRYRRSNPWGKMIKKALVDREHILFDETPVSNDVMFSCLTGHYAKSINCVNEVIYTVTMSKGSLTNIKNFNIIKTRYIIDLKRNKFLREINKNHCIKSHLYQLITCIVNFGLKPFVQLIKLHFDFRDNPFVNTDIFVSIKKNFKNYNKRKEQKKKNRAFYTNVYKGE